MKNSQKIQLGNLTVLVVALMQAGVVCAGNITAPGLHINTSIAATFGSCSSSGTNPIRSNSSTCTSTSAGPKAITLAPVTAYSGSNIGAAVLVDGNTSAIDTINFSGNAYGNSSNDAVILNTDSTVIFNLVTGNIFADQGRNAVSGTGFTFGNSGVVSGGVTGTGFTVNNFGSGTIFGGTGGIANGGNTGTHDDGANGTYGNGSDGGNGGSGGTGGVGGVGGNSTPGGVAISGSGFSVTNEHLITGGAGGAGAQGGWGGDAVGGDGGNSGSGTFIGSAGAAGSGGTGGLGGAGGTAGAGGAGNAAISGSNFSVNNLASGTITGGAGGTGGTGGRGGDARGGYGGYSTMGGGSYGSGGTGGVGGAGGTGGTGGTGGAGITGSNFTLTNRGTITGGAGGAAGSGGTGGTANGSNGGSVQAADGLQGSGGSSGSNGAGAVGVISTGHATIVNSGTISGGKYGGNYTRVAALNLSGAGNTLTLEAGSTILGSVISNAATTVTGDSTVAGSFLNSGSVAIAAGKTLALTTEFFTPGNFTNTGTFTTVVTNTEFGKLTATGTATLTGSTLFVDASTLTANNNYNGTVNGVIHATSIAGTFASSSDNSVLFNLTPVYTATDVNLNIATASNSGAVNAVTASNNTSAQGAASALDQIIAANPGGAISAIFLPLTTTEQVSNAVSQTVPQVAGVVSQAVTTNLGTVTRIVQSRQDGQSGKSSGDNFYGDQAFWFKPFGSWANQDTQNGVSGYKSDSYGMIFGADANLSDINRVGVAFAYSKTDVDSKGVARQNADIASYTALLYGSHSLNTTTELNFQGGVGFHNTDGGRTISIGSTNSRANSSYDSWSANVGAGVARTISLSEKTSLTPSIRIDYSRIRSDGYNESGAGVLNLNVRSNTSEALVLGVDSKVSHALSNRAALVANFGIGYDLINDRSSLTSAFAGAPTVTFTTVGLDPSPWLARGGFGVVGKVTETMEISARYDFEVRENFDNQTASVKFRLKF